jgi:hypothetical protein
VNPLSRQFEILHISQPSTACYKDSFTCLFNLITVDLLLRSVGIVRSRTKATELLWLLLLGSIPDDVLVP